MCLCEFEITFFFSHTVQTKISKNQAKTKGKGELFRALILTFMQT